MIGKLDTHMHFNETALELRAQRQQLLASNIANADTPNFKARDVDFASALQGVLARTTPPAGMLATTAAAHIAQAGQPGDFLPNGTPVLYRIPAQASADGNTVDMDVERNQFADNAMRYEAIVTMVTSQIRGMQSAVQGGQ